jgi:asparagine synthase (glutamine-hydrolysing)
MCGITGTFAYADTAPLPDRAELERVGQAMATRGPDGSGVWFAPDRRVGFAHRRLAIIDLSESGRQPMSTPDGRLTIVFNGEIYNYRELRRELEAKGCEFRSHSDTEVLLQLYADRGAEMLSALRGMYALAVWDEREQELFLARDAFGIKPLYIADDGSTLRFASQVKALVAAGGVPRKEEPAGYVGFLLWGFVPEPYTLYRGIRSLPAGSHLSIQRGGRKRETVFFSPREEILRIADRSREPSRDDAYSELRIALQDSVEQHLVSDVPVGLFLSSGVDSCVVANFAAASLGSRLHTLTLGFSEFKLTDNDETVLASRVAADLGVEHSTRWTSREDVLGELSTFFADMDQPSMDGLNTWLVSKAARQSGIKVALSGLGGDEMFAGYPSFSQVPLTARWGRPFAQFPRFATAIRKIAEPLVASITSPKYAGLAEYGSTLSGAYLLRRALYMPWELERILDPAFVQQGLDELRTRSRLAAGVAGVDNDRLAISALELDWYLRSQLLRDADWAGMAHSLEIRVPFVDVPLFRTIVRLVLEGRAPTKKDVVWCVNGSLPAILATRPKTGFNVPVRDWFVESQASGKKERGLRTWARNVLDKWELPDAARPIRGLAHSMPSAHNVPR